ncbi:MAG: smc 1 [Gemmataceae bacterium]|nr:smc 1 [Gemmataceae bacterium]
MANPNPTPDPPPSISAAELRRRLLASTPPPIAATASTPDPEPGESPVSSAWGGSQDLLSRLRMPGNKPGSGPIQVTRSAVAPPPVIPDPDPGIPVRSSVNRRTPAPARHPGLDPASAIAGALNQLAGLGDSHGRMSVDDSPMAEIQRLRGENKELRTLLNEMKHLLQEASDSEQQFAAKEKQYVTALEEKEAQTEELSAQLGAIEEQIAKGELAPPPPVPKTRTELEEWGDELEKENSKLNQERKRLDDERRQLREDEEALERQMREMEVSMARERAMMARQETELKRLSAEIQHELDLLQRGDAGLREQMAKFQRRAQEVMNKPGSGSSSGGRR